MASLRKMTSYDLTLGHDVLKDDFIPWEKRQVTSCYKLTSYDRQHRDITTKSDAVFMPLCFLRTRKNPQSYVTKYGDVTPVHLHTKLRWVFFFISYIICAILPQLQIQTENLYPFMEFSVFCFKMRSKLWIYHRTTTQSKFVYIKSRI